MKKKIVIIALSAMLLGSSALHGCGKKEEPAPASDSAASEESAGNGDSNTTDKTANSSESTKILGEFSTVTYTGEPVDQSILADADVTMINVWTTFCGYCIDEMPILQKLSEEYKEQGLQIIGIVSDVEKANDPTVTDIVDTLGLTYPNLVSSDDLQAQMLQFIQSVPTTVFVDSDGNTIGKLQIGARDEEGWRAIIESTLESADSN